MNKFLAMVMGVILCFGAGCKRHSGLRIPEVPEVPSNPETQNSPNVPRDPEVPGAGLVADLATLSASEDLAVVSRDAGVTDSGDTCNTDAGTVCYKLETAYLGTVGETVVLGNTVITLTGWTQKTDSPDYCGFTFTIDGDTTGFGFTVKSGVELAVSDSLTGWANPNGDTGHTVKGISHIIFCKSL